MRFVYTLLLSSEDSFLDVIHRMNFADVDGLSNIVNIDRENVLEGGMRAFRRRTFDCRNRLSVRFSAEDGTDTGRRVEITRKFDLFSFTEILL